MVRRILIVEDDVISRKLYATVLRDELSEIVIVEVGRVALAKDELGRDGGVALVLTDLGLPDGDGREILAAVRASSWPATPVVAISGMMTSEVHAVRGLGFDEVLVKPIELAAFRATCRRLLG
jgi:DNA-binding response OmpR family regulator